MRDYGTGSWDGGDPDCDHAASKPSRKANAVATSGLEGGKKTVHASLVYGEECGRCGARRVDRQLGLEPTPDEYVQNMVAVFREVRRVLRRDGTCWLNLGDSYAGGGPSNHGSGASTLNDDGRSDEALVRVRARISETAGAAGRGRQQPTPSGLKPKDLVGIPWKVSQALQAPYYTGKIADERDRVWLAATLDAEGTICGFRHARKDDGSIRTGVHVTITNSNRALLDNAQRIWPTTRVDHNPHGDGHLGGLPTWRWIAHNVDSKALLMRELYPYLIAKKNQAVLAYNLLEMSRVAKRSARTAQADEIRNRRDWIVDALSRLNHAQDVDIPSWCVEPPTLYEPGWYLRADIIWAKPNPMPESVTDRPTKAHEYLFLLTRSPRYFYDADAIREAHVRPLGESGARPNYAVPQRADGRTGFPRHPDLYNPAGRNCRSVWEIATQPYPEAHFATFPEELARRCILAGTSERGCCPECGAPWERIVERNDDTRAYPAYDGKGRFDGNTIHERRINPGGGSTLTRWSSATTAGWRPTCEKGCKAYTQGFGIIPPIPCVVLDPFLGSGTTALVARRHGRKSIGIELSPEYAGLAARRLQQLSLLATDTA